MIMKFFTASVHGAFFLAATFASSLLAPATAGEVFTQRPMIVPSVERDAAPVAKKKLEPVAQVKPTKGVGVKWIWASSEPGDGDRFFFRKQFSSTGVKNATLTATCDNGMTIWLNGAPVAKSNEWERPVRIVVTSQITSGQNELLVEATNAGSLAGLAVELALEPATGPPTKKIVSDKSWKYSKTRTGDDWSAAKELGPMGRGPWGNVFLAAAAPGTPDPDRGSFKLLPGFQVEKLYTVPKATQGSWVSITFDKKGRLIASDQGKQGLYRVTPPKVGSDKATKVEKLDVKMSASQGMLAAFDSLYVSVNGGPGSGLWRLRDTTGDDQYDEVKQLKALRGGGEHGPHALRLSPDGKSIYMICGNHTDPPENFDSSRLRSNWDEDLLLPRQWDARGHARGKLAPGGWIAKTDPDGKTWEMISTGYRNPFDMDLNADGELFAYDADMEWDLGSPWYRPTRVVHATSGSEFGWRSGTGKWPTYFPDSLPPAVDIGPGSPVGVVFGYGTKFPARYQNALYILDWTFGTMYAIHFKPDGASYTAVKEEFLSRTPLPLTDVAVGPDGALYFTIGGRGTQSEMFRVTYVGKESTAPAVSKDQEFAELRALRHQLEAMHGVGPNDGKAIDFIWKNLGHEDRFIRYAARVALEHRPAKSWQQLVLKEKDPSTLINGAVALARQGDPAIQSDLLTALDQLDFAKLSEQQQLELLRAYSLTFTRLGMPNQAMAAAISKKLDPFYPAKGNELNRELCRLLVYLKSPTVITKTLALMEKEYQPGKAVMAVLLARNDRYGGTIAKMLANQPELEKTHYAFCLRTLRYGWTLPQRKAYFKWFEKALTKSGGASYQGFINNIRTEALANLSDAEKLALESDEIAPPPKVTELPKPQGPGQQWTLDQLVERTKGGLSGRNFEKGRIAYAASRCVVCHRFDGAGGATGPDLTNVAGRFSYKDLSEAIVDPSKVISDQYRATSLVTVNGKVITGRVTADDGKTLTILTDPEDATKVVQLPKADIEEMSPSKLSLMPKDLLNQLNEQEVLDLLAYLLSRGNPNDQMFGGGN